ncbi:MutS-related protein [Aminirod propionatiphilus]|uniref:DNA mismatch repair protein MutS n=1 Tax=Aminirod propionatiphilus TaxID=3415223 RepID=A0ACD1DVC0_9BACT|nr:DNA mismatch repair protein MutS [Synergistota bacterium]
MKPFLLNTKDCIDFSGKISDSFKQTTEDLNLNILFQAISQDDKEIYNTIQHVFELCQRNSKETILYRQNALKDAFKNSEVIFKLYKIAEEAIEGEKKIIFGYFNKYPSSILWRSIELLENLEKPIKDLLDIAKTKSHNFKSEAFINLFLSIATTMDDEFVYNLRRHIEDLRLRRSTLLICRFTDDITCQNYNLTIKHSKKISFIKKILTRSDSHYSFKIHERDESGARAISEITGKGINYVANSTARAAESLLSFFKTLKKEIAFYVGCINLKNLITSKKASLSFPFPSNSIKRRLYFRKLYDICLFLKIDKQIISNSLNIGGKNPVLLTGANQGGKSTFLRSIGIAQMMMQAGMPVPAECFSSEVYDGIFTHFKREEDMAMKSGKLDEELRRLSAIVDGMSSRSLILLNESFASTNESEASEIADQVIRSMTDRGVRVLFVTHLYEFAHRRYTQDPTNTCFLRAERKEDGLRTFRMIEQAPLSTSYGNDIYNEVFGKK